MPEEDRWTEVPKKFWDDTSGTEYEGWQDPCKTPSHNTIPPTRPNAPRADSVEP